MLSMSMMGTPACLAAEEEAPVWHLSQKWTKFCSERNIDSDDISVNNVLNFLPLLYESGYGYSSINTAHSALSSFDCNDKYWPYSLKTELRMSTAISPDPSSPR